MSDCSMPDFNVPELQVTDLTMPDFSMPDASLPDPPSPVLMELVIPAELDVLAGSAVPDAVDPTDGYSLTLADTQDMQDMSGEPEGPGELVQNVPGMLDSSADSLVLHSPDNQQLPSGLAYDALNSTAEMTTRERHLGMLLLGLEGKMPVEGAGGTGR